MTEEQSPTLQRNRLRCLDHLGAVSALGRKRLSLNVVKKEGAEAPSSK